jgi:O-antigen/teichoic acid export membrane protein
MNWGISNFDNAIVGRTFGPTQLGLYNRAFTLANAPADSVVATLQTVLFSACSRADGEVEPIRRAYFACLSAVSLIVFPAFWAMSACAPTVIIALYGEAWRPSIVLFRPLVLAISVNAVMALAGPVLGAVNKVREEIVTQAWSLLVAVIVFLVASRFTMTSFAWSVCGVYLFRFIVVSQPTLTYLGVSWREVLRTLRGPSIVAGFISVVLYVCNRVGMNAGLRPMAILVCLIAIGAGLLVCQLFLFGHLILAPQVTAFLQKGVSRMPKAVGSFLETMMERQNARMRAPSIPVS